jgi:hypothetical protein
MSPLVGWILEVFGFFWLCIVLAAISLLATILSLLWNVVDYRSEQPILNEPEPTPEELARLFDDTERADQSMRQVSYPGFGMPRSPRQPPQYVASPPTTDNDTVSLDA